MYSAHHFYILVFERAAPYSFGSMVKVIRGNIQINIEREVLGTVH